MNRLVLWALERAARAAARKNTRTRLALLAFLMSLADTGGGRWTTCPPPEVIVPDQLEIEMPDPFDPSKPGTVIITSTDKPWVQCYPGGWQ